MDKFKQVEIVHKLCELGIIEFMVVDGCHQLLLLSAASASSSRVDWATMMR